MTYAKLPNLIPIMDDDQHTIGIETYNKNRIIYMNKYLVIFLIYIVLASCQKTVIQNYTPKPQDYIGTWEHEIWINDTTEENEYLGLILRKSDNDTIKGVFYSVTQNGDFRDGSLAFVDTSFLGISDTDEDVNVLGKFTNDSLYVTIKGSYSENASAKAVMYLENDSSLLWKVIAKEGEIYVPDNAILKRGKEASQDSFTGAVDTAHVQLKGKLSEYSVYGNQTWDDDEERPIWYISLLKNGKTISKADFPCFMPIYDLLFLGTVATDKGFNFSCQYGRSHNQYKQIFVIEYINNDFYLVKTIDYTPSFVPYRQRKSENRLKDPIPFSKLDIGKMMQIYELSD